MVARERKRKYVSIDFVKGLVMSGQDLTIELDNLPVRQPKPEPPEGGISICAASRKYKIPDPTISRWVSRGIIPVILRTKNEVYINESAFAEVARKYKQNPGQGKRTI